MSALTAEHTAHSARLERMGVRAPRRAVRPMLLPLERRPDPSAWDGPPMVPYDIYVEPEPRPLWATSGLAPYWRQILYEVANRRRVDPDTILASNRGRSVVAARYEVFSRLDAMTSMSLGEIGRHIGGYDGSTVRYGIMRHRSRVSP